MLSSKRAGLLSAVLILGPQLTQPRLLSLRDRGLGDQTAENELAGRVEPVAGQRIDDLTPYALLDGIQVRRWLRTAPPRDAGDDSERGCGLAGHGRNSPSRWKLARDPKIDHVSGGGWRARRRPWRTGISYPPPRPSRNCRTNHVGQPSSPMVARGLPCSTRCLSLLWQCSHKLCSLPVRNRFQLPQCGSTWSTTVAGLTRPRCRHMAQSGAILS